jgi:release factor glutamine methyltransferase
VPAGPILELCAGAGQIGLVAATLTGRALVQVERDPVAAAFAARNARAAGLDDYELRVVPLETSLFAGETFPLIIADPPYLPTADVDRYPDDPRAAIDGGADGMAWIRQCLALAAAHLAPFGAVFLQMRGARQADSLRVLKLREHDDERAVALLTRNEIERNVIG